MISLASAKEIKIDIANSSDINTTKPNIDITEPPTVENTQIEQPTKPNRSIGIPDGNCPYGDDDCNIEYIRNVVGRRKN
jgi:hypothetical protein